MRGHKPIETVNIGKEKVDTAFVETQVPVQAVDDVFRCCFMQGQRLPIDGVDVVKVILRDWESILHKESGIRSAALTEDDLCTAAVLCDNAVVQLPVFPRAGRDGDHPKDAWIRRVPYGEEMRAVSAVLMVGHQGRLVHVREITVLDVIEISFRYLHNASKIKMPRLHREGGAEHFRTE